jgi:hypothetical protein
MTIPQLRALGGYAAGEGVVQARPDAVHVTAHDPIRAFGHRDGALGVLPKRQAGDSKHRGLFLNAS